MISLRIVLATACLALLGACVGPARQEIGSFSEVGAGETVVVGRIELVPPLRKNEQKIQALNSDTYENRIFLLTDEKYRILKGEPATADFAGRIEATFGKNFFVRSESKPFFILGGVLFLEIGSSTNRAYFPGGLKVSIQPGDKAVYVGTLKYHRDEFFEFTKVAIEDDYDRANTEFRKKFGTKIPLRKSLLTRAK
jgi:hypothetical protein